MKEVYVFSGLGVDERVFKHINFSSFQAIFIKWIPPLNKESIESYAKRLLLQIKTNKPVLIGLSFGGIIAIEVAKQLEIEKIILIASAKNRKEIPFYFRLAGRINLQKFIPVSILKKANFITNWFFGVENPTDNALLAEILQDTDPVFLNWAIDKIVNWQNTFHPENSIHIHGKADRILPVSFVKADYLIEGGGHFMTINKSEEINLLMEKLI
jgi:pimeloyl-ACP methyl ester carboxylesterase